MKQFSNRLKNIFSNMFVIFAAALVIAGVGGFVGVHALESRQNKQTACHGTCVAITASGMNPDNIAVKVGDFVQFNPADGETHNISLGAGDDGHEDADHAAHSAPHEHIGDYSSGDFKAGEAWKVQFKKAGTYHLHDHYHPKNQILVVVYQPGASNKIH